MIYRIAEINDVEKLAEMRWIHEHEHKVCLEAEKEEFLEYCTSFLKEELKKGEWVYWIAEENSEITANIFLKKIRKIPKQESFLQKSHM